MEKTENSFAFVGDRRESVNSEVEAKIQGWGADLDMADRPGVPKDKAPYIGIETLYPDIEQQITKKKILKSIEHQRMPPVFGTSCPPKAVSGMMREFAFKYSEGAFTHWFTLLFADRVDMVEDLFADLSRGHLPNLFKEMGLAAEWKYNRKNLVKKATIAGVGIAALAAVIVAMNKSESRPSRAT